MSSHGQQGPTARGERRSRQDQERRTEPLRLCAVSRTRKAPDDLIRFVLGPDGTIVPDLARRLPGRGVWIGATRRDVAAAVRQNAFARSLKHAVLVPDDLPDGSKA